MIPPVYVPCRYTYTGLAFTQLPPTAQHYLVDVKLMPHSQAEAHNPDTTTTTAHARETLTSSLLDSLKPNDTALVYRRHEVFQYARSVPRSPSPTWEEEASKMDAARVAEVVDVILPDRRRILDDFVVKFDALVWFDAYCHKEKRLSWWYWQRHRNALLGPILECSCLALVELDKAVTKANLEKENPSGLGSPDRHATTESTNWRATPRTHLNAKLGEKNRQLPLRNIEQWQDLLGKSHNEALQYGEMWHRRRKIGGRA